MQETKGPRLTWSTGQHAHTHGILENTEQGPLSHRLPIFPQELQRHGYERAFIGKWHMGNDDVPRPGFDYWLSMKGQGSSKNPAKNENGVHVATQGHITHELAERAVGFSEQQATAAVPQTASDWLTRVTCHVLFFPPMIMLKKASCSGPRFR